MGFGSKIGGIAKQLTLGAVKGVTHVKKNTPKYARYLASSGFALQDWDRKRTRLKRQRIKNRKKIASYRKSPKNRAGQAKRQKRQNKDYGKARASTKAMAKYDKGQYKQKMAKKKYKGMRGMKYSGKNKSVTSTADRMQARRRRTAKKKK